MLHRWDIPELIPGRTKRLGRQLHTQGTGHQAEGSMIFAAACGTVAMPCWVEVGVGVSTSSFKVG